jgi:hypothetical protein
LIGKLANDFLIPKFLIERLTHSPDSSGNPFLFFCLGRKANAKNKKD